MSEYRLNPGDLVVCIKPISMIHERYNLVPERSYIVAAHRPELGRIQIEGFPFVYSDSRFVPYVSDIEDVMEGDFF